MPTVCFDYLMEYRKDQIAIGLTASDDDYIFKNIRSNLSAVWIHAQLTVEWAAFIADFGLKKITVHDIRHSHATDLLSMGVPIQDVSRRLGHSDVATTLKIYTHSNMKQDKLIAQILEERYGNHYVENKLNFKNIASIIAGEYYAEENDVMNAVSFITGKVVNSENKDILLSDCKQYLLENYSYLESIMLFLNDNTQMDMKNIFIELVSNISENISNIRPMNTF